MRVSSLQRNLLPCSVVQSLWSLVHCRRLQIWMRFKNGVFRGIRALKPVSTSLRGTVRFERVIPALAIDRLISADVDLRFCRASLAILPSVWGVVAFFLPWPDLFSTVPVSKKRLQTFRKPAAVTPYPIFEATSRYEYPSLRKVRAIALLLGDQ